MRLLYRVHVWFADRFTFIQYPGWRRTDVEFRTNFYERKSRSTSRKQIAWIVFVIFWGLVLLAADLGSR